MNASQIITQANIATLDHVFKVVAETKNRLKVLDVRGDTTQDNLKELLNQLCSLLSNCSVVINALIFERSNYKYGQPLDVSQKLDVQQLVSVSGNEVERQINAGASVIASAYDAQVRVSCIAHAIRLWDTICLSHVSPSVEFSDSRQMFLVTTQHCTDAAVAKEDWRCVRCAAQLNEENYCPAIDMYLNANILLPVCDICHSNRLYSGVPTLRVACDPVCMCCFSVLTSYAGKYKYMMSRTPGVQRYVCDKCFALPVLCVQLAAGLPTSPEVLRENRDRLRDTTISYVLDLLGQLDNPDSKLAIPIVNEIYSESKKYQNIVDQRSVEQK